ncbi:hypothetical protein AB0D42_08850 [Streptomyces sp. NPDC048304]|uniref:hypothetical protein n=1 Tax=unclassified Streptomyces TaxID=2593676 RepID=UPI0033E38146
MNARRRTRTLLAGGAMAAVLAVAGTAGVASADSTPKPAPTGDGAQKLCKRVPKIDRRIARALKRLDAGPGTRGSIARLQQRVDNAEKAGHTAVATFLKDRLEFRKSLVTNLKQRQKDLGDVRTWCQADGGGKAAS